MKLSTMWRVDQTIDDAGSSPIAEQALAPWAHDDGTLEFFRSSANFLYLFEREGTTHFLRFAASSERSRDAVESEIALLRWLGGEGIDVAVPVRSDAGNDVETVETEAGVVHAVVFEAVEGDQLAPEELDLPRFREWGAAVGRLHAALRTCQAEFAGRRPTLRDRVEQMRGAVPMGFAAMHREADQLVAALDALPAGPDAVELVHLDLELDNLVWGEHGITVLDFDDCARGWHEADIAFALRDLLDEGAGPDDRRVRSFVEGYGSHRPLSEEALARVPLFSRLARMMTAARIAGALDLVESPDQADWLNGLIGKLRGRMAAYEASLGAEPPGEPSAGRPTP